jgi:hypothetical protein
MTEKRMGVTPLTATAPLVRIARFVHNNRVSLSTSTSGGKKLGAVRT